MFNKRYRWLTVTILAIATLAFSGFLLLSIFAPLFGGGLAGSPSPAASRAASPQADLEAQAKGYELVLQREPDNQTALRGLIDIRIQQGNIEATIAPLEKLAELNPDQPEYQVLLAQAKQRIGDREGAAQAYRSILSTRPGDLNALQGLVDLMLEQDRPQAAIGLLQDTLKTADEANRIQPGSVDVTSVQLLLGRVYAEEGRFEEAIAVYDQSIESDGQDFRPVLGKALVLQSQGKNEEAQPLFVSAAALAPAQYKDQINQIAAGASPSPAAAPSSAPSAEASPAPAESPAP
ncbi:tetratricopeptide repeat protein [Oscillatoria sp. FACHB-1407]|uniref:tetratricopeptide repeat protein n=1 Tax=Oscillatoria sp. FACHB-1407 TaxID=2692847 RepID=UPI0016856E69|nr:tetratricopeptide repeat protein [Oscillatoria sp. FACHB-1407]MBD2462308.1 tetratricopeptide repeat protein [Oscillatoria sp. FACHB-1407]